MSLGPHPSVLSPRSTAFEDCKVSRATRSSIKPRLAYILAASHSGSTLLAMLLGSHPEAWTVGELKGIRAASRDYRCSCGSFLEECGFWLNVKSSMAGRGFPFDITAAGTNVQEAAHPLVRRLLQPLHRGVFLELCRDVSLAAMPPWHAHLTHVQARNSALVESLVELTGAKTIIDSSKTGLRAKYLLRNSALDVRIVRLIRDGRAVALTHTNPAEFADAADPRLRSGGNGCPGHAGLSMTEAALLWRRSNEEADCIAARLGPSQYLEVRYERLCMEPAKTVGSICDFLGLGPLIIGNDFRPRKQQHVVGNGMRFDSNREIKLDERWRGHLPTAALNVFDRVAGDLNRRYGYV